MWHENRKPFIKVCRGVYGRKVIYSNMKSITLKNVVEVFQKAMPTHNQNRREIDYLYHYVSGDQPILYRTKDVRPEIKNDVVENHSWEITRFAMAQTYGEPIQYVSVKDDQDKSREIDKLNDFMRVIDKPYYDIQIGDWQSTCGTAYRETWSLKRDETEDGHPSMGIDCADPRYNFIIYSSMHGHPPLMSCSRCFDEEDQEYWLCTTKSQTFEIKKGEVINYGSNGHGRILLTEYPNNVRRLSDVEMEENTALVEALNEDQYVVSEDGHLVAYQENGDLNTATKVVVKNLESGKERTAECESDECIRPLGFVKNDFVYGVAKTADTGKTVSGEMTVPMYKVEIQNSKSEIVKTYQADGTYVLDAYLKDNMVTLNRAVKDGNTYTSTSQDYITNNTEKEKSNIYLESYVTDLKETQVRLTFEDGISDKEPKVLRPKQIVMEDPVVVEFEDVTHADKYYVYGYGQLQACCEKAGEAIRLADSYSGVVVDATQNYVWERGNRDLQYTITDKDDVIQRIADRLKQKEAPVDIMKSLNDDRYLDLTGCATEELLYIINQGSPVIGMLNAENSVILIGYTDTVVIYVDPETGERSSVTYEEMDQMTQGSGNTYIG